ncbi:TPA: hypothetical protein ACGRTJ_004544 [Escherichia coli]
MNFNELEEKGLALVEARNKTTSASQREILNKEIRAIRNKQIEVLKAELIQGLSVAIPTLVQQLINESDVLKQIRELQQEQGE